MYGEDSEDDADAEENAEAEDDDFIDEGVASPDATRAERKPMPKVTIYTLRLTYFNPQHPNH